MGRGGAGRGRGARKGEAAPAGKEDEGTTESKGREKGRRGDEGDQAPCPSKAEKSQQAGKGADAPSGMKTSQKEPDQAKSKLAPEEPGLRQALGKLTLDARERAKTEKSQQAANGAAALSGEKGSQKETPDQGKAEGGARRKQKSILAPGEPGASGIPCQTQALGKCTIWAEERPDAEAANGAAAPSGKKASRKEKGAQKAREAEQTVCALVKKEPAPQGSAVVAPNKRVASQKANPPPKEEEEVGQPGKESSSARRRASKSREPAEKGAGAQEKPAVPGGKLLPKEPGPRGNRSLRQVLEKLKLAKEERSKAAQQVNRVRDILVEAINSEKCFPCVEVLGTGSYYERLKISSPNEYDIMLKVPDMKVELESCNVGAFYYVKLKRNPGKNACLEKFLEDKMHLSSSDMLSALRKIIEQEVKKFDDLEVRVERKKPGSPAVTLLIGKPPSVISVDIILALEFKHRTWCECTKNGLDTTGLLGGKVNNAFLKEPLYLVPKLAKEGKCLIENTWRLSFSHIEKDIMNNHGNSKTCCEKNGQKCCRKDCLKLLKYLLEQLKTKHENRKKFEKFHSYLAKTAFLHACTKWSRDDEWLAANLDECFDRLLDFFVGCLREAELKHFFIPEFNLLQSVEKAECSALAKVIESERNNGFLIFFL
ncbi:cyclic GMP-AMP synthase-like [Lacerta agilis]|uniref:cyclic GMP-AMP synthase-like n=1 Tax=Lacerta agilis TaxID=80427 RepID=UPI0014195DA8|nr:cyclic GMP-AMP synthase-like [Lacerta agilis]